MSSATPSARACTGTQKPYVSVIIEGDGAAPKDTSHNGSINNAKHPRFNSKPRESSFFRWWLFELLASVISIASLISLVLVLLLWTRPSGAGFTILAYPQRHRGSYLNGQQGCPDGSCWGGNEPGSVALVLTAKRRLSKPTGRS
jgi:hypothetical protein